MRRKLLFMLMLFAAGLYYALRPVDSRGRNTWLPGTWAEWIDRHDWWFNFWAFVIVAAGMVWAMGPGRPALYRWFVALAGGSLLAVALETVQIGIPGRHPDPADLTASLWGSLAGGSLVWLRNWVRVGAGEVDRPARICFLDQTGQLGGAELMLLDLGAALRERAEVILFADGPFREALQGRGVACEVEGLGENAAGLNKEAGWRSWVRALPESAGLIRRLVRRIRGNGTDVVYSNTAKALLVGAVAARWARRPLVHHLHDLVEPAHFSRVNRWLLVGAANWGAARVIANSEATARAFVAAGGRAELLTVIPNGFDLARFERVNEEEVRRCRAEWGGGDEEVDGCVFGLFGRITPWKGQMIFLEALSRIPVALGVVVGAALFTEEDRIYEEALRERAAAPDLAGRVFFCGFREDVVSLLHAVDVVVHCSTRAEPFGRVIVEAQLCGVPVLAARGGGAAEIVEEGVTGRLAGPGDLKELVDGMIWFLEHEAERREMARRARERARERYELAEVVAATEAVVEGVLKRGERLKEIKRD